MEKEQKLNVQKIINEYNDMKNKLRILAEAFSGEKKNNENLKEKNQNLEIKIRILEEENNKLKTNYELIQKRYDQLQKEFNEKKSTKGYSMLSYFTGGNLKDENEQMKERIKMLESELEIKIKENEQCHVEVFEYKTQQNDTINQFEEKEKNFVKKLTEKENHIKNILEQTQLLNDKVKMTQNSLDSANQELLDLKNNFNDMKSSKEKNEKNLNDKINKLEKEFKFVRVYNDFLNEENLFKFDFDFMSKATLIKKLNEQKKTFEKLIAFIQTIIKGSLDSIINNLKEKSKFNLIISTNSNNKDLGTVYEKINSNLIILQQYIRALSVMLNVIEKEMNHFIEVFNLETLNKITLSKNIAMTLLNKSYTLFDSIAKLYIEASTQEKNDLFDTSLITKLNSFLGTFLKKIQRIFNYNPQFNLSHIQIETDRTFRLKIKVSNEYFEEYQFGNEEILFEMDFLNSILDTDVKDFCQIMTEISLGAIKLHSNQIESIRKFEEESKTKSNISYVKSNEAENVFNSLDKILEEIPRLFTNELLQEIKTKFSIEYYDKKIFFNSFNEKLLTVFLLTKSFPQKTHEIPYHVWISNEEKLNKLIANENIIQENKIQSGKKYVEYEEKIAELKSLLSSAQNDNDILKMKLSQKREPETESISKEETEVEEPQNDLSEYILQQSSLNKDDYNTISLTGGESELTRGVDLLYHRTQNQLISKLIGKIKFFNKETEVELKERALEKEYEAKIKELKGSFETKESELNRTINQRNEAIEGFTQQINFLSEAMSDYEQLKDSICKNCKKFIKEN